MELGGKGKIDLERRKPVLSFFYLYTHTDREKKGKEKMVISQSLLPIQKEIERFGKR